MEDAGQHRPQEKANTWLLTGYKGPPLRAFCHDPVSFAVVLIVYIQRQFHKGNIFSNRKGNISNMLSYKTFIKIKDESKCVLF